MGNNIMREEFRIKYFLFEHPAKEPFYLPQWRWPDWTAIFYRFCLATYSLSALIHFLVKWDHPHPAIVYVSTWAYIIMCMYFTVSVVVTVKMLATASEIRDNTICLREEENCSEGAGNYGTIEGTQPEDIRKRQLSWYLILLWILANMTYTWAFVITIVFLAGILPQGIVDLDFPNVNIHIVNVVFVLIDIAFSAMPIRILHFVYAVVAGAIYSIIYEVYWTMDPSENVLYPKVLDWNNATIASAVNSAILFGVLPLLQLMVFGFYRLRIFIYQKIYKCDYKPFV